MRTTTALAGLLVASGAAHAQDVVLDDIVLSATLLPTEAERVGATVDVIGEDEIARSGEDRLVDLLRERPGLSFAANGPPGTTGSLRIRGLPARYVAFRFDGIDVSDPTEVQTAFNAGALPLGGLGRVEVLRGSQSALYGTQAVGGVVSVSSLAFPEAGGTGRAAAEGGSRGHVGVSGAFARGFAGGGVRASVSHLKGDGFSAADEDDGNDERDAFRATRLTLGGFADLGPVTVGADLFNLDAFNEFDESFPVIADGAAPFVEEAETVTRAARVYARFDLGRVANEIGYAITDIDRESRSDDFFSPGDVAIFDYDGERRELAYQGAVYLSPTASLAFGASSTEESYADTFGTEADERVDAVFAEAVVRLGDRLDVAVAARHDDHSRFGGFTTGRVAATYALTDATLLRGSVANGFRAPSLFELNGPNGNPDLDPETSTSVDLGVEHVFASGAVLGATAFYAEVDDLVGFLAANTPPFGTYIQTSDTIRTRGLEIEGRAPLNDRAEIFGNYTFVDGVGAADGLVGADRPLLRTPRHAGTLGVDGTLAERLTGRATVRFAAGAEDVGGVDLDDYAVVDLGLAYEVAPGVEAYGRVENAFDAEYQTIDGYGTADRGVYAGLRASF